VNVGDFVVGFCVWRLIIAVIRTGGDFGVGALRI
jgi:hypothetical protein